MLAIRLPSDIESRLNALAERTGRTKTFYAREAILTHLATLEAQYLEHSAKSWNREFGTTTLSALQDAHEGKVTHFDTVEEMVQAIENE